MRRKETYHDGVDEGVDKDKHPDRWRHVADASPHAKHCSCMVIGLQQTALFPLGQDDEGVYDFVEL